jgi:mannitol/fructose-specific phosphotransferase system IIA component (Ntr-type)
MLTDYINEKTLVDHVTCQSWEELVDLAGEPLLQNGSIEKKYLQSIKDTVKEHGAYMVFLEDVALFHGRPDSGVNKIAISLAILDEPTFVTQKRVAAAFVLAATDNDSHSDLLGELVEALQDDEILMLLRSRGSANQILQKLGKVE